MTNQAQKNITSAIWALEECEDYFDNRADADYDLDGPVPNKEMVLHSKVQDALDKLRATKLVTQPAPPFEPREPLDFRRLYSHPLAQRFHDMAQTMEALGASQELTAALNCLHALRQEVEGELNRLLAGAPTTKSEGGTQ